MSPVPGWHGPTGIPGAAHISSPISQGAERLACPCPVCPRPSGTLRASLCPVGSSGHHPLCGYRCCEGNGERGVRCGFRRKREMKNQGHHFLPAFPQQRATVHRTGRRGRYRVTRYRQPGPDWLHCRKPQRPGQAGQAGSSACPLASPALWAWQVVARCWGGQDGSASRLQPGQVFVAI